MFGPPFFLVIFQILTTEYFYCLGQLFSTILKFLKLITFEVFLFTTSCLQIGKCFFYLVKAEQVKRDIATIITSTMHFDSVGQEQFFLSIPQKAPNKLSQCRLLQCYTCVASQALVILDYYYCLCPPLTQDNVFSYSEKV